MEKTLIAAVDNTLQKAISLLDQISDSTYTNNTVGPYYSSIGSHLRHVLDFFECILVGVNEDNIDLTSRKRDELIASQPQIAKHHITLIQDRIAQFTTDDFKKIIPVKDDCGCGMLTIDYSLKAILSQANSHATHHYATIAYLLHQLNVNQAIEGFGYNPTTPSEKRVGI